MPNNVDEAFRIDELNNNHSWRRAIEKNLKTVCAIYKLYEQNKDNILQNRSVLKRKKRIVGYKEITCYFVFDIKLDGSFTRKARFCANGSKTDVTKYLSYFSIVSCEYVCIAFLLSNLNDV